MTSDSTIAAIRFGYGLPLPEGAPVTPEAMLALLAGPDRAARQWPSFDLEDFLQTEVGMAPFYKARREKKPVPPEAQASADKMVSMTNIALQATVARALDSPDGLRERLVAFWASHFTVVIKQKYRRVMASALVEDAIRPNLTGRFGDLLTAVTLHPAMLEYLDQSSSVGPDSRFGMRKNKGLNENLARELLELHSLGVGAAYSQTDVTQMAELLTGLTAQAEKGMVFEANRAEPGPETVLGKAYDGKGLQPIRAVLQDLALRPETAAHLARKLAVHFVSDEPDPDLVAAIEAAYIESGGDLMASYGALLQHPAAWAMPFEKVRQPYDFVIAGLRAMGISGEAVVAMDRGLLRGVVLQPMAAMGQPYQSADGPDGWPEEAAAWITPL
ncbi:MAG: DUF1800 domain-containing protein, partial [Rhodobacteraceae bacterium]|nr:DUF1800 domain-containing protein [Paracoccaceae bacterium]